MLNARISEAVGVLLASANATPFSDTVLKLYQFLIVSFCAFHIKAIYNRYTYEGKIFVSFDGYKVLNQTVSIRIFEGVCFSRDKIHCLDPSKQPWALANL